MIKKFGLAAVAAAWLITPALAADTLHVETSKACSFDIKLRADLAPKHVGQITKLAAAGFYDGIVFHRSKEPNLDAEFSSEHFARGTVGMARSQDPNSANSQFFVMFADGGFLDGQYTVWGQVDEAGMACVDKIEKGEPPANPDKMTKVTVQ